MKIDVQNPGLVSVADQGYPRAPSSPAASSLPAARDVCVMSDLSSRGLRVPRSQASYRPQASEVAIDPRVRRLANPSDLDCQVVGSAGAVPGHLEEGPGPVSAAEPPHEEIYIVPRSNPFVPGRYPGPEIGRDQRPSVESANYCVLGAAGSVAVGHPERPGHLAAHSLPSTDVYIVSPPPSAVPGRYAGPDKVAIKRVESSPPPTNVQVKDQCPVVGQPVNVFV
jgi:hypothetical protein